MDYIFVYMPSPQISLLFVVSIRHFLLNSLSLSSSPLQPFQQAPKTDPAQRARVKHIHPSSSGPVKNTGERERGMAGVSRLTDAAEQLQARCAELVDGAGCETAEVHPYRSPAEAPLRKLTVDLIKTYRKINDVSQNNPHPPSLINHLC